MLIQPLSDLHTEDYPINIPKTNADVIVLAGDIGVGVKDEMNFAKNIAQTHGKPVVFVLGNHSFYLGGNLNEIHDDWRNSNINDYGVHFLDNGLIFEYHDFTFIGGTLWTDFNRCNELDMANARWTLHDYHNVTINNENGNAVPFVPKRSIDEHFKTKDAMDKSIKESTTKNIVVTHMAPSIKSIHPKYVNSPDNPVFNSHMDDWVKKRNIELWIHGHTHQSCDYMIDNTRVVCNPRGHPKDGVNENKRFFANLVVEV